jgi:hypothetical protein
MQTEGQIEMSGRSNIIKHVLNNKLIRIILALLFFLFIYKIVYQIFTFFALDDNLIKMYMGWLGVFIILISILPQKRYSFTFKKLI